MFNFVMKIVLETIEIITKAVIIKNNKQHSRRFNTNTTSSSSSSSLTSSTTSAYSITVAASTSSYRLLYIALIVKHGIVMAAPQHEKYINRRIWPPMKNYDIWSAVTMDNVPKQTYPNDPQLQQQHQQQQQKPQHYQHHDKAFQSDQLEFVSQQFKENIDYWHSNYNNINNNNIHHHDHHINTIENNNNTILNSKRRRRVLHLFPVPVDGECLADDGRRTGTCHNAYECRMKGGAAKGECAMGFGVCCIFTANCSTDTIIGNNITYLVSPNFPTFMPQNLSSCSLKVKLMDADISQLRIDFIHFSLGQPNRRTGVCDGDVFNVSGGPGGTFSLCGQNSGQHIYYDVGGRSLPRQTLYGNLRPLTLAEIYPNLGNGSSELPIIEISMNFTARFLPQRLWEIRISQIPFSQRAPAGCLQYFTGNEGVLQTFNFADNGRHLANQNYRICMRQETNMCSILYQPCDDQSFRIGPIKPPRSQMSPMMTANSQNINPAGGGGGTTANNGMFGMPIMGTLMGGMGGMGGMVTNIASTMASMLNMGGQDPMGPTTPIMSTNSQMAAATATTSSMAAASSTATNPGNLLTRSTVAASTTPSTPDTPNTPNTPSTPLMNTAASSATSSATNAPQRSSTANTASATPSTTPSSTASTTVSSSTSNDDYEDDEGSGAGIAPSIDGASRRPPLATGGFDLLGFLRSAFDYNRREGRQLMSNCRDRITMPCIIEDFIGTGLGPLPGCEPVHCGAQFCASGLTPCRIESTVTPFYMGIHFGDGSDKGSAEDNIGACIRFNQVKCM